MIFRALWKALNCNFTMFFCQGLRTTHGHESKKQTKRIIHAGAAKICWNRLTPNPLKISIQGRYSTWSASIAHTGWNNNLRQDPPLDLSFWSFLTFLHHGIEEVERHLLWKFYKKIRRKSWSNVPPKLVACIGFLYKVVHKIGRLRKFNRSRGI